MTQITYAQAINDAIKQAMKKDDKVICYGLGTTDPKRIFGSTNELVELYGDDRVFDMPTSENGMTGIAVGAALEGYKSVMSHQRLDFFLLAMDQLVNSAAKWHYMFNGQDSVPLTVRLIMGRGWGQGPTHSQNLQAWFAHVPGLKVVMPTTPHDMKGLLLASIFDPNPVVVLEHRWLYNAKGDVPEDFYTIPLGKAKAVKEGSDYTIVTMSYLTVDALRAAEKLEENGISVEVIDLRTVQPWDKEAVENSIRKTGRLLALDTGASSFSIASEIVSHTAINWFDLLKSSPKKLASPDFPVPTSPGLSEPFYVDAQSIIDTITNDLGKPSIEVPKSTRPHDIPGDWFTGPF